MSVVSSYFHVVDHYILVISTVSYQIVPVDTQYGEIPLAVVRSSHQHAGIGHLFYKELSQRLQNVGITTIFCWARSRGILARTGFHICWRSGY